MGVFVEFNNVHKVYQMGEVTINALHNTNFQIEKGEMCVIVGALGFVYQFNLFIFCQSS